MKTYSINSDIGPSGRQGAAVRAGAALIAAVVGILLVLAGGHAGGEEPDGHETGLPGMCNGRSDADVVVNAHARSPKFILNVSTDGFGMPEGVLIFGQGANRLYADLFCRVWQHIPGQPAGGECESGESEESPEGAVTVHAVGFGSFRGGPSLLVRVDARETEEGRFYRLRYRPLGGEHDGHEDAAQDDGHEDDGCEGGGWTRYPVEGWAPLNQLNVRTTND
jgi:hypothetical protein